MIDLAGRPLLKPGCRLAPSGDVLLIPEGVLRLEGPAWRIVTACDGNRTVQEIIDTLISEFPKAVPGTVSNETSTFLAKLAEKGVLAFR